MKTASGGRADLSVEARGEGEKAGEGDYGETGNMGQRETGGTGRDSRTGGGPGHGRAPVRNACAAPGTPGARATTDLDNRRLRRRPRKKRSVGCDPFYREGKTGDYPPSPSPNRS